MYKSSFVSETKPEGEPEKKVRKPTLLSNYKYEARYLKSQIKKAQATLRMREKVQHLRTHLEQLQDNLYRGFDPETND
jgi:hypothetical protein